MSDSSAPLAASILAAGEGRRLGCRPKTSLRIGGLSILERLAVALRSAGIAELSVVLGPYRDQLRPLALQCGARVLEHRLTDATLIDSQRLALDDHLARHSGSDLLLVLADLPLLTAAHIRPLVDRWHQRAPAVHAQMPVVEGVRGHPLILSWHAVERIAATPRQLGIRAWLAAHAKLIQAVPSQQTAYVADLDTPDDLAALQASVHPEIVSWPDPTGAAD
ncbi:MAG TPA: NTP transferase domain-containing protein [Thauera sp.]|nr:NTP transferase domain-containing protein [Thauera sp.]HRA81255.1 NTP transferase domain-containing protein [Thauera sp.]